MATNRWQPSVSPVAQVATTTITGDDATTTYKVTINGKVVSVLGAGTGVNATAAALQAALAAASQSLFPEFAEVTWTVLSAVVKGTAKTPGRSFVFTTSVSGGAGTIGAFTSVVANTGPWNWDNAGNWSLAAVPVNTNDVYLDLSSGPILEGLAQSAVTLNSLNIAATYTGAIGLPEINTNGAFSYREYRSRYLAIGATTANLGYGGGAGATLMYIDFGSIQANIVVGATGNSQVQGIETAQLKGTHASNVLTVVQGTVAFCGGGADVGTLATLNIGYITNPASDSTVRCGPGATVTTINQDGGVADVYNAPTTLALKGGGVLTVHAGNMTGPVMDNGTLFYLGQGTLSSPVVGNNGVFDCTQNPAARTISGTMQLYAGYTFNDPFSTCGSYNVHFNHCGEKDGTMNNGIGHTYAVS